MQDYRLETTADIDATSRTPFQYENIFFKYGESHYKEYMVMRPSYLYDGNPYIGKTASPHLGFLTTATDNISRIICFLKPYLQCSSNLNSLAQKNVFKHQESFLDVVSLNST